MRLHNTSLSRFANFLQLFCFVCLFLIAGGAWFVTDFFAHYQKATAEQADVAQTIAKEIDQSLLPINSELNEISRLMNRFSSELALLSIDSKRTFDELEHLVADLSKLRGALSSHWPEGLLPTSLLERITSNIIISEDIALEVLERRNPNYTFQLYEESVDIIRQTLIDTDAVLDAVSNKLSDLAAQGYELSDTSLRAMIDRQARLRSGITIFIVLSIATFAAIISLVLLYSRETQRRLDLLRGFAKAVESGDYDQSISLIANDASGHLARSLESMSWRLVELLQESEHLAEKAQESSKAKSEFLASMSHEIRTPMNGVIGLLDILSASKLDAQQKHYLKLAQSSATSLLSLLNDILDFSKIESGKLALEKVDFDLLELLNDFVDVMSHAAEEKQLALMFEVKGMEQHGWVSGDPTRLRQVLTNLVGNALKFTHKGEITLSVDLSEHEDDWKLRVEVKDTGIGIPADKLANLFDSFTQVDASTTRKYGGTGLGLTISNQLVVLMGADSLHVESEPGKGSCFWFSISIEVPEHPPETWLEENPVEPRDQSLVQQEQSAPKKRVLLVEDNAVNQVVAQTLIEADGFEVDIANHGQEALDKLLAHPEEFSVVFMDCQMPVLDGYSATQKIRTGDAGESYEAVPIIAMTANAMEGDRQKCIDAGMNDYISKPIDAQILAQKLKEWSERKT